MTEPETEIDALDRLEAALGRIAAHAADGKFAPELPGSNAVAVADSTARTDMAAALDRLIVQLRDALASIGEAEHG
jgi:sarcosine oxidase gamma subunit